MPYTSSRAFERVYGQPLRTLWREYEGAASADLPAARSWVWATLGDLAIDDKPYARLRDTLQLFLRTGSYTATAERMMLLGTDLTTCRNASSDGPRFPGSLTHPAPPNVWPLVPPPGSATLPRLAAVVEDVRVGCRSRQAG